MPVVTVLQGPRDVELKRELVSKITDAFVEAYGVGAETVQVWITEVPADSWGASGKLIADSAK
ncbi:MAG: 4-oxalocrotonate tautomerase family protein [Nonomuraea sp.]|jgi:4-oxalocrotonate tautomerase|nr:4-oxalocrotonate tautomerase family protein [Nonomuraea sp.]NUP67390.1 4-oxalocrotonate tautomerase family protein [Nonomuraea sp.]NUP83367.1 4-oxalocrotonate tautomerase family protein [Nonomuraea sp.]NUT11127.1 4-oxalocrotonate tautomerase family protein [Nonomuraea sp.]